MKTLVNVEVVGLIPASSWGHCQMREWRNIKISLHLPKL